jgi:hypothetical protein
LYSWPELTLKTVQSTDPIVSLASVDVNISDYDEGSEDEVQPSRSSPSGDVNELDGFISLGGAMDPSDVDDDPAYNPLAMKKESVSFTDKVQEQSKKRRKEKGEASKEKIGKKAKR